MITDIYNKLTAKQKDELLVAYEESFNQDNLVSHEEVMSQYSKWLQKMNPLDHIAPKIKSGKEPLTFKNQNLNFSLLDFWQWSVSDILSNATRGRLAEFIVATATNIDINLAREEWGAYDLLTTDGIKLEVKSAGYLQSWQQKDFSTISFSTRLARHWDELTNKRAEIAQRHADVYVFCLLKHKDKQTVNPLNLNHWEFYVLSTCELNKYTRSQHSITLNSLRRETRSIQYSEIDIEIKEKHKRNYIFTTPPTQTPPLL